MDTGSDTFKTNILSHEDKFKKKQILYRHPIDKIVSRSKNHSISLDSEASNIFEVSGNSSHFVF